MKIVENICCEKKPITFPRLMKGTNTGAIYLMINSTNGTVVANPSKALVSRVGRVFHDLQEDQLEDYTGSITLSND